MKTSLCTSIIKLAVIYCNYTTPFYVSMPVKYCSVYSTKSLHGLCLTCRQHEEKATHPRLNAAAYVFCFRSKQLFSGVFLLKQLGGYLKKSQKMCKFILDLGSCRYQAMHSYIHTASDAWQHQRLSVHLDQACPAICHMQTAITLTRTIVLQHTKHKLQLASFKEHEFTSNLKINIFYVAIFSHYK